MSPPGETGLDFQDGVPFAGAGNFGCDDESPTAPYLSVRAATLNDTAAHGVAVPGGALASLDGALAVSKAVGLAEQCATALAGGLNLIPRLRMHRTGGSATLAGQTFGLVIDGLVTPMYEHTIEGVIVTTHPTHPDPAGVNLDYLIGVTIDESSPASNASCNVTLCPPSIRGDGQCDPACDNAACGYDCAGGAGGILYYPLQYQDTGIRASEGACDCGVVSSIGAVELRASMLGVTAHGLLNDDAGLTDTEMLLTLVLHTSCR